AAGPEGSRRRAPGPRALQGGCHDGRLHRAAARPARRRRVSGRIPDMSRAVPSAFELYFGSGRRDPWQLAELEELFFHSLGLRNGTRKTTWRHRLDDLNALVQQHLPPQRPLEIMDVAVSRSEERRVGKEWRSRWGR